MRSTAFLIGLLALAAAPASAQPPTVGVRASGMGGAFTGVADDATATYWNPAGLAAGAFVGLTLDAVSLDTGTTPFVGLSTPPLGISYFQTVAPTAEAPSGRNGAPDDLRIHHVGATFVQSVGDTGLAVGGTAGLVHASGGSAFGLDAGIMLSGVLGKLGVAVHNVTAPSLGGLRLDRQVRAGASVHLGQVVTAAADVDLTTTSWRGNDWREAALGLETHPHEKAWIRGGFHWNTAAAPVAAVGTVGASVAVYGPIRLDGQASFGAREGNRGWGVGFSVIY